MSEQADDGKWLLESHLAYEPTLTGPVGEGNGKPGIVGFAVASDSFFCVASWRLRLILATYV
jgi:hypothetical protein